MEEKSKELPPLTWDTAADEIPSLTAKEHRHLKENAEVQVTLNEAETRIKQQEQEMKETPVLTWDNVGEFVPALNEMGKDDSEEESKEIEKPEKVSVKPGS